MAKKVPIKYTSRDFNSIKRDLEDYARRYYPDTYKDFSEASFGSLMIDTVSYVGDILSYYVDYNVNESFFDTAIEYNNVLRHSRQLGYKYRGKPAANGIVSLYILVPANTLGLGPNADYIPILKRGTMLSSKNGVNFILTENVNFNSSEAITVAARVNPTSGLPTYYAIRMPGRVTSGDFVTQDISVGSFERFRKVKLRSRSFTEMMSVFDAEGNEYFEVDYLSQNVVLKEFPNPNFGTDNTPSIIKPALVARRFTVERDGLNDIYLQFGFGSEEDIKINNVADPSDVVIDAIGKSYVSDVNFDPYKLLNTDKFGIGPSDTTLTVNYRINPSVTLEVLNEGPISGDSQIPSADELRIRSKDFFATQNRAVTAQDYESFIYSMPGKYGAIKRCRVMTDNDSLRRNLNIYLISEDESRNLSTANSTIKNNVKTWLSQHKMINDTIDLLDALIVNLAVHFKVVAEQNFNKYDVLEKCVTILKEEYSNKQMIGQPFEISRTMKLLNKVDGVVDVESIDVVIKKGGDYASTFFPIEAMKSADGRYIMAPKNVVFEIKFPDSDIRGTVV